MMRSAIQEQMAIPSGEQRLILRGRLLNDDSQTIQGAGLKDRDVLHVIHHVPQPAEASTTTQLDRQRLAAANNRFQVRFHMQIIPDLSEQAEGQQQQQRRIEVRQQGTHPQRRGNGQRREETPSQREGSSQQTGAEQQTQQEVIERQGTANTSTELISEALAAMVVGTIFRSLITILQRLNEEEEPATAREIGTTTSATQLETSAGTSNESVASSGTSNGTGTSTITSNESVNSAGNSNATGTSAGTSNVSVTSVGTSNESVASNNREGVI
uniref:Ubiquitin-like domain-containing protein n=1 Tax=Meloidogyne floridensis TaxID=298350 RepID=A0A915P2H1_9BILA